MIIWCVPMSCLLCVFEMDPKWRWGCTRRDPLPIGWYTSCES